MSDENLIKFPTQKGMPTPVADVVGADTVKDAKQLIVIGCDEDNKFFLTATHGSIKDNCYLLDICKFSLLKFVTGPRSNP